MIDKKDVIIFDGQVFQSAAWDRGMGKYSMALLNAIKKHSLFTYGKTYLVFSKNLPLSEDATQTIKQFVPDIELVFLDLLIPNIHDHSSIKPLEKRNKIILGKFVDEITDSHPQLATFVVLSLFIDQVCSVFPPIGKKILLFYDLIPLQYNERYGGFHNYPNYLSRFKTILEADCIWTISQTVADDLMLYMGLDPEKLYNIDGAPISRDHQEAVQPQSQDIPERYLLMPSGNDLRKNNLRAVQAFKQYRENYQDKDIHLVITSFFDDGTRSVLQKESDNLIFTGNVTEGELLWLYENSQALLFTPEYEGLGLPILEAIESNRPIVCSNLTVFGEMSSTAFYYADQFNPLSISEAIRSAVSLDGFSNKIEEYPSILARYTWEKTAKKALQAIGVTVLRKETKKYKIAIFTPDPTGYSAIGKFNLHLHPTLSEYFDIDYYVEEGVTKRALVRPSYLFDIAPTYSAKKFGVKSYAKYDAVIYHIGNSEFHLDTIKNSLYLPGFAIMHDTNLKPIFSGELLSRHYITEGRLSKEDDLDKAINSSKGAYITSIVNAQLGIIVHSRYAKDTIDKSLLNDSIKTHLANLPVATPLASRVRLDSEFAIGFAGIIHPAKGLNLLDEIVKSGLLNNARIYLFGIPLVPEDELRRIESLPNVTVLTNLTDFQFQTKMAAIDVMVNYRPHYNGEASAATIEAMRAGVIPIVRKIGWFDELPDNAVIKVDSEDEVLKALVELSTNKKKQTELSKAAQLYTKNELSQLKYAQALFDIVSDTLNKKSNLNSKVYHALRDKKPKSQIVKIIETIFK